MTDDERRELRRRMLEQAAASLRSLARVLDALTKGPTND